MERLGTQLVQVHSQGEQVSLLQERRQLELLDTYGGLEHLRAKLAERVRAVRDLQRELRELGTDERQAEREALLLRHEVAEIEAAGVQPEEEEQLLARRQQLRHARRLRTLAAELRAALRGGDEAPGVLELLQGIDDRLREIRALDAAVPLDLATLIDIIDGLQEIDRSVRRYEEALVDDPAALDALEERLLLMGDLKRKYGPTLGDVLRYREEAVGRLAALERRDERASELGQRESAEATVANELGEQLSAGRSAAATGLELGVQQELAELGMASACFVVKVSPRRAGSSTTKDVGEGAPVVLHEMGADEVTFLFSANPGEEPRSLARIASGGELSRLMLALESVLLGADETPVLVFDEIDQGVGGRMGHVLGQKLWRLARHRQVFCVTHLPQMAAYADAHYVGAKHLAQGRTITRVQRTEGDERVRELALMLAGERAGAAAHEGARELLSEAAAWKRSPLAASSVG
jgi:DNA repair protein RecN (Recombination protein N)